MFVLIKMAIYVACRKLYLPVPLKWDKLVWHHAFASSPTLTLST